MDRRIMAALLCVVLVSCSKETPGRGGGETAMPFMKGSTMSFVAYLEDQGLTYRENGRVADPYRSLRAHGANCVRLQLDLEPFADREGVRIDWQQMARVKADARRAQAAGLEVILTIKPDRNIYSATETVVNLVPTCWLGIANDADALGRELQKTVQTTLQNLGTVPTIVAIGNEVNLNFLGVEGAAWDAGRIGKLLQYGFAAVKAYNRTNGTHIKTALHIASPHNVDRVLPDFIRAGATDFDIIAVSWYAGMAGHSMGNYASFAAMARGFETTYGRKLLLLETACSFTNGYGDKCDNAYYYPTWSADASNYSPAKQRAWLRALAEDVRAGGGLGVVTWGTESLPDDNIWMYPAPWAHGSTWENNSYWDFANGNNLHEGIDWMQDL